VHGVQHAGQSVVHAVDHAGHAVKAGTCKGVHDAAAAVRHAAESVEARTSACADTPVSPGQPSKFDRSAQQVTGQPAIVPVAVDMGRGHQQGVEVVGVGVASSSAKPWKADVHIEVQGSEGDTRSDTRGHKGHSHHQHRAQQV
jgi:hypothetical protein